MSKDLVRAMAQIRRASSPSFSPDGEEIAFVSDETGVPQVWMVSTDGSNLRQITDSQDQVGSVRWSPRGDMLALSISPGGGMNSQLYLMNPDGSDLTMITKGGATNNWMGRFTDNGSKLTFSSNADSPAAIWPCIYDIDSKDIAIVSKGEGTSHVADLSGDHKRAIVSRSKERGDSDLFLIDLVSGDEICLTPHDESAQFGGGFFSAGGDFVYMTSNRDRELQALCKVDIRGPGAGDIEVIREREGAELDGITLSRDRRVGFLIWNEGGRNIGEFIDLKSMKTREGPSVGEVYGGTFSLDGHQLAVVGTGARRPIDIWVTDVTTAKARQLTKSRHDGVDLRSLIEPSVAYYKGHDGIDLSGWVYQPKGEGPFPFVLSFHGGPEGQERPLLNSMYQALLANGIGVFGPNVRGSSGFGRTFMNLDNGRLRFNAVKDIESSINFIVDSGIAAKGRLGIMGASYGGFMVTAGLTEYPDLIAAGATICGMVNFETFFAQTEPWMAAISKSEFGDPEKDPTLFKELSPIHKIDRVISPTIVLHGANDTNVPVVEAEQVVENLRSRAVPVEYVLFPDEGHGFSKTANRIAAAEAIFDWFKRYL